MFTPPPTSEEFVVPRALLLNPGTGPEPGLGPGKARPHLLPCGVLPPTPSYLKAGILCHACVSLEPIFNTSWLCLSTRPELCAFLELQSEALAFQSQHHSIVCVSDHSILALLWTFPLPGHSHPQVTGAAEVPSESCGPHGSPGRCSNLHRCPWLTRSKASVTLPQGPGSALLSGSHLPFLSCLLHGVTTGAP